MRAPEKACSEHSARAKVEPRLELLSSVIGEGMGVGRGGCRFVRHDGWMDGWMDGCAF